jgi:hypothetical protein
MHVSGGGVTYNRVHIFMSFLYISMPISRGLQQLSDWINILRSKLKVFMLEH